MRLWLVFILTLLFAPLAGATIINAASCSQTDVASAIGSSSAGDTVVVPAGASCNWTSGISFTGITLLGAGSSSSGTVVTAGLVKLTKNASAYTRMSGFRFTGTDAHLDVEGTDSEKDYLVSENYFNQAGGGVQITINANGGVIWNNTFQGPAAGSTSITDVMTFHPAGDEWALATTFGTADTSGTANIYIEHNTFYELAVAMDGDEGARMVIRYNDFESSGFVFHGTQPNDSSANPPGGARQFEIYDNTFHVVNSGDNLAKGWIWARGESGVVANNAMDSCATSSYSCGGGDIELTLGGCASYSYPVPFQVGQSAVTTSEPENPPSHPILIFGNTGTGTSDSNFITAGSSGTAGGTYTCSNPPAYVQASRDYYTSNHWSWSSYTYPHPLADPPPTKVYATNGQNSNALNGSPWSGVTPPYDYYVKVDPNAMIAGNTITIFFGADLSGSNQTWSITAYKNGSSVADTFTSVVTSSTSNSRGMTVYTASNIVGGEDTLDIRLTGGSLNGYWQPLVFESNNTASVDASSCNTGSSASLSAGTLTTSVPGDIIIQGVYYPNLTYGSPAQSSGYTAASGWTIWHEDLGDGSAGQYEIANSSGSVTPTITAASSQTYVSCAVAYSANSSGGPQSTAVYDVTRDALPKNSSNPWKLAANITGQTVVVSYMSNDAPAASNPITSTPSLTWTASGTVGCGTNGHNCLVNYCAHSTSAIGPLLISLSRTANTNDGIFHIYDLSSTISCTVDYDSGESGGTLTLAGQKNSGSTIDVCADAGLTANCITPSVANDFFVGELGEYWGTITGLISPTPSYFVNDAAYYTGNTVDGYSQTDENNGLWFGLAGPGTSAFTVKTTGVYTGGAAFPYYWAARVTAYKLTAQGSQVSPPTFTCGASDCSSGGVFSGSQSVVISSFTGGATFCYTVDGTIPTANGAGTCTHGTTYSVPVVLSSTVTLKAVGSESGFTDSSVTSGLFNINIPALAPSNAIFSFLGASPDGKPLNRKGFIYGLF